VALLLQLAHDVDPWKLMSFGMYAVPARRPEAIDVAPPPADVAAFQRARATWGRLAAPPPGVTVRELRLSPVTGRLEARVSAPRTGE
jgi:hypothetical protein